jgi:hypothetical protein
VLAELVDKKIVVLGLTLDEDLAITELRSGLLAELQTAEVLSITGRDSPLLNSLGNRLRHYEDVVRVVSVRCFCRMMRRINEDINF